MSVYTSHSVQGHHKRTVREKQLTREAPTQLWLPVARQYRRDGRCSGSSQRRGERKDLLLWRYCPEISSVVLSIPFPLQVCRNSASFTAFFEQRCSQLKNKLSFPSSVPCTTLCGSPTRGGGFPSHLDVHLPTYPCHVSKRRWVDRATQMVLTVLLGSIHTLS